MRVVEPSTGTAGGDTAGPDGGVTASPGGPVAGPPTPVGGGDAVLVDAKIGDINGRPVFAGEFFGSGPGALLAQKAREPGMSEDSWMLFASGVISKEMQRRVTDELLEAEARSSMKPEQRQGLRAWLQDTAVEGRRRQAGGSRAAAERALEEEQNQTLEQWAREEEGRTLVRIQIRKIVENQVVVSGRDLRLEYERSHDEFNPPPRARLRMIRVPTDAPDDVAAIGEALIRGEPFEQVAAHPANTSNREQGGLVDRTFSGDLASASLFGSVEPLNAAARALRPGEWTRSPVVYDSWTAWLKLESVEVIRRPLSDESVQLELAQRIRDRKFDDLLTRYLTRLSERASMSDIRRMQIKLLAIARERYWAAR